MKELKVGQVITLYNIKNETSDTKNLLGRKNQTFMGIDRRGFETSQRTHPVRRPKKLGTHGLFFINDEVKIVARLTVKRLHNNDPATII